jgi:hypothetical protein
MFKECLKIKLKAFIKRYLSSTNTIIFRLILLVNLWALLNDFFDRGSFDQNSLDQNCVLSLDQNFDNQLTKFFDTFHLIESFNNDFIMNYSINCQHLSVLFCQLIKTFINVILSYF